MSFGPSKDSLAAAVVLTPSFVPSHVSPAFFYAWEGHQKSHLAPRPDTQIIIIFYLGDSKVLTDIDGVKKGTVCEG